MPSEPITQVRIAVEDHGAGVPEHERTLIFERFARGGVAGRRASQRRRRPRAVAGRRARADARRARLGRRPTRRRARRTVRHRARRRGARRMICRPASLVAVVGDSRWPACGISAGRRASRPARRTSERIVPVTGRNRRHGRRAPTASTSSPRATTGCSVRCRARRRLRRDLIDTPVRRARTRTSSKPQFNTVIPPRPNCSRSRSSRARSCSSTVSTTSTSSTRRPVPGARPDRVHRHRARRDRDRPARRRTANRIVGPRPSATTTANAAQRLRLPGLRVRRRNPRSRPLPVGSPDARAVAR